MGRSPWMEKVYEILSTRGPQPMDTVMAEAGSLVPPGYAFREREKSRRYMKRDRISPVPPAETVEVTDEAIWAGRRRVMYRAVWGAVRDGPLELFDGRDGRRWVRINPAYRREHPQWARFAAMMAALPPEVKSANAKKSWETRRAKGWHPSGPGPEARAALIERMKALPPEERRRRSLKGAASMTPEQQHARGLKSAAALTPEQRHERAMKGLATRRARAEARPNGTVDPQSS